MHPRFRTIACYFASFTLWGLEVEVVLASDEAVRPVAVTGLC